MLDLMAVKFYIHVASSMLQHMSSMGLTTPQSPQTLGDATEGNAVGYG